MLESEAIKELHSIRPRGGIIPQKRAEAIDTAIKALEEVQQYRAIGTVEECRENKEFLEFLYNRINPNDMEQYLSMYHGSGEKIN